MIYAPSENFRMPPLTCTCYFLSTPISDVPKHTSMTVSVWPPLASAHITAMPYSSVPLPSSCLIQSVLRRAARVVFQRDGVEHSTFFSHMCTTCASHTRPSCWLLTVWSVESAPPGTMVTSHPEPQETLGQSQTLKVGHLTKELVRNEFSDPSLDLGIPIWI